MMEPTERSIPPEIITRVSPNATMIRKELSISRLTKFYAPKKLSYVNEPITTSAINIPTVITIEVYLDFIAIFIMLFLVPTVALRLLF